MARMRTIKLNVLLAAAMVAVSAATWILRPARQQAVTLPVSSAAVETLSPTEQYRLSRDSAELRDMAALEALCDNAALDASLRADAAVRLQSLVEARRIQLALEGALLQTRLAPCVVVAGRDTVTIVTPCAELEEGDHALLMELVQTYAQLPASAIRVICP